MNGIHDMGGMHGFGVVDPSDNVTFHNDWEARVLALTLTTSKHLKSNIDRQRFRLEVLPPEEYLSGYFERWYLSMLKECLAVGIIDEDTFAAIEHGVAVASTTKDGTAVDVDLIRKVIATGSPSRRSTEATPCFKVGDKVRTLEINPGTHTRLPRYARDKVGEIIAYHGTHVFPDSNAQLEGEDPRPLYTVRFSARNLWGENAKTRDSVALDLWEPYLEKLS